MIKGQFLASPEREKGEAGRTLVWGNPHGSERLGT